METDAQTARTQTLQPARWSGFGRSEKSRNKGNYSYESFDSLSDIPVAEAKSILTQQAEFMHRRVMEAGAPSNDPTAHVSAFWENIGAVLPPNGRFYFVRDADRRVVGCGAIRKLNETVAEMKHLFVQGEHRGQGLGSELVLRRLDDAREMGVTSVVADTIAGYPEMPTLYRRLGFVQVEPTATSGTIHVAPQIADCLIFFRKVL